MQLVFRTSLALAFCLLAGCESDSPSSPSGVSTAPITSPTPLPSPSPSPTPTPSPTATAAPAAPAGAELDDGETIIVAEGDSISVDYAGYYTGYFRMRHPEVTYRVAAQSGSTIRTIMARRDSIIALKPDIVTLFVGANDLGGYVSAQEFADMLFTYSAELRSGGTKVLVASVLPRNANDNPSWNNNHNAIRGQVTALLRAAVGKQIDGLIDFGSDPTIGQFAATTNGQLYKDGLHPTDRNWGGQRGGQDYLFDIYDAALTPVIADIER